MVVTVAVISWVGGCRKKEAVNTAATAVPVMVTEAVSMNVPIELREIGAVEAYNTVSVTARVSGQLMKVGFREGDEVNEGDLLFQIDPRPYEAALLQAQANLERDHAALAKAETDIVRYKDLVQKDYVTKQEYDLVVSTAAESKATVKADSALVRNAQLNLEYCGIRAPIAGRTGNLHVKEGNLITANSSSPLVTLNQVVPVYVTFAIPEQQLSEVRRRASAGTLSVWAVIPTDTTRVFEGKLTFIDNTVNPTTGTIMLKGTFPNKDKALWPGQYVQVGLVLGNHLNATVIPLVAVQSSQDKNFIYVVAPGDTVQMRPIVEGPVYDGKVVVEKGVTPGERVVTDGQLMLRPGSRVMIRSALTEDEQGGQNQ
ncbi:efflux RND transporter periplasmic adaptor subunit [bacterium]|nr:efflux RND transporter periplasmic adaptor subunit [bacterium]